jgi:class 3 adenylate cyclase
MLSLRHKMLLSLSLFALLVFGGMFGLAQITLEQKLAEFDHAALRRGEAALARLIQQESQALSKIAASLAASGWAQAALEQTAWPELPAEVPGDALIAVAGLDGNPRASSAATSAIAGLLPDGGRLSHGLGYFPGAALVFGSQPVLDAGQQRIGTIWLGRRLGQVLGDDFKQKNEAGVVAYANNREVLSTGWACEPLPAQADGLRPLFDPAATPHSLQPIRECLRYQVADNPSSGNGYALLLPADRHSAFMIEAHARIAMLAAVLLPLMAWIGLGFTRGVENTMQGLHNALDQIERENYAYRIDPGASREMAEIAVAFNQAMKTLEEKERLRRAMEQLVSRDFAEALIKGELRLEGEQKQAAILYADIHDFIALAQGMEGADLLAFLNNYFTRAGFCVDSNGGLVDKYQGGAVLALFGLPASQGNDARATVLAALDLLDAVELFNLEVAKPKAKLLRVGIGIHAGSVVAGNLGAENRVNYSVVGSAVNLARRLQILTKRYGVSLLVSQPVAEAAWPAEAPGTTQNLIFWRELDLVQLSARADPLHIYEVFPRQQIRLHSRLESLLRRFQEARQIMQEQHFQTAADAFAALLDDWPEDIPTLLLLSRCQHYADTPGAYAQENPQGAYLLAEPM